MDSAGKIGIFDSRGRQSCGETGRFHVARERIFVSSRTSDIST
jgi:hypothetical protein